MKAHCTLKSAVAKAKHRRKQRQAFPYVRAAKMWAAGKSIATIAHTLGRLDKNNPKDPYHSLRNFLYRMHKGYALSPIARLAGGKYLRPNICELLNR